MGEWQPIKTAPRDGNEFLAFMFGNTQMVIFYDEPRSTAPDHCWYQIDSETAYHKDAPSHWMPLPAPPKDDGSWDQFKY